MRPGVDAADKVTGPLTWSVAGQSRADAHLVSTVDGRAAYGGTPSDAERRRLQSATSKGAASASRWRPSSSWTSPPATRCPIPTRGAGSQPPYPWRGRITVIAGPRPARQPRQDGRRRDADRSLRRHAPPYPTSRIVGERGRLLGPRRVVLPPLHPALRAPCRRGRRRRGLHHRLGAARAHLGARRRQHLSLRRRARRSRCRRQGRARPRHQSHLRRRLVGVFRPPTRRRLRRRPFPPRPAVGLRRHRCRRHRRLLAARRLARRCESRRPPGRSVLHLRSRLPARQSLRRRGVRLVLRQPRRSRRAGPHAHHRRRYGKPWVFRFKDIRRWWLNQHFDRPGGVELGYAHRLGAAVQALLVHRARLPRRRQRRQPAQRVRRPQELGVVPALLFARHARRLHAAPLPAGLPRGVRSRRSATIVADANPISAVYGDRMVDIAHIHVYCLGCAPLSGLPHQHRRLGRRRQLAARPLGHGPARQRAARRDRIGDPRRLRLCRLRHQRARRHARRLRHRPRAVGARGAAAARARLLLRCARERRG